MGVELLAWCEWKLSNILLVNNFCRPGQHYVF